MKSLILHSGGLDSTLCLLKAREANHEVVSLGIDYGQRHRIELEYALDQCRKYGIERRILRIEWDKPIRKIPENRSLDEIKSGVSPAFLPGRNAIFLSLASAEAAGIEADEVWMGVNALDFSGYPDCRPEFIEAFRLMLKAAIPEGPKVVTPLLNMSKPEIAAEAFRLGLRHGDTWSCYQPHFYRQGIAPCGKCDACILHEHAWKTVLAKETID